MYELLTGGYENKVEGDYLKDVHHLDKPETQGEHIENVDLLEYQNNVKYRIRKTGNQYLTEQKDNFRTFVLSPDQQELLVDYRDDQFQN